MYTNRDAHKAIQEAHLKHDDLLSFVRQGQRAKKMERSGRLWEEVLSSRLGSGVCVIPESETELFMGCRRIRTRWWMFNRDF